MILWLLAATIAQGEPCDLSGPPDAPFEMHAPENATRVHVIIELWTGADQVAWTQGMLDVLNTRALRGAVVVGLPDGPLDAALHGLLASAVEGGHEIIVRLDEPQVPKDALASMRPFKSALKPIRDSAGAPRTVLAPIQSRASEALLGRAGFRTILHAGGSPSATGRMAAVFEGQPRINVVLYAGPYSGTCGTLPVVGPFTPLAADRATQALHAAARSEGAPVVRVSIDGALGAADDAAVLGRWLDEVLIPAAVSLVPPGDARAASLRAFRAGSDAVPGDLASQGGGRLVAIEQVEDAARALQDVRTLPRVIEDELVPTEAFYAFLLILADEKEGAVVRLGALSGPSTAATSTLQGPVQVPREAVVDLAVALLAGLPEEVPAAMSVDGKLLTASELLLLFASTVRGDPAPTTMPVAVPEPNARGLGWGDATRP